MNKEASLKSRNAQTTVQIYDTQYMPKDIQIFWKNFEGIMQKRLILLAYQ